MGRLLLGAAMLLLLARPQSALGHVPVLHGHLVALVQHSDVILIGTVRSRQDLGPRSSETEVRVERLLHGRLGIKQIDFRGAVRFAPQRYVFFLRRVDAGWECVQQPGSVFPAPLADDAIYRRVVGGIADAAQVAEARYAEALRAALLPALSARTPALRYEAALDFAALIDQRHPLTTGESSALKQLLDSAGCDPALRSLLQPLVKN